MPDAENLQLTEVVSISCKPTLSLEIKMALTHTQSKDNYEKYNSPEESVPIIITPESTSFAGLSNTPREHSWQHA